MLLKGAEVSLLRGGTVSILDYLREQAGWLDLETAYLRHTSGADKLLTRQTQDGESMLVLCWPTVVDGGPALNRHWVNVFRVPVNVFVSAPDKWRHLGRAFRVKSPAVIIQCLGATRYFQANKVRRAYITVALGKENALTVTRT